jgi:hypothetical protein
MWSLRVGVHNFATFYGVTLKNFSFQEFPSGMGCCNLQHACVRTEIRINYLVEKPKGKVTVWNNGRIILKWICFKVTIFLASSVTETALKSQLK